MITLSCPSCGANVKFVSKASVFAVCSYCNSTLVRQDMDLKQIGKMSQLQDDMSPFQIGTTGWFASKEFELVGRMKVVYDLGFWNEWYAVTAEGQEGWLAEAQGFYGMCLPIRDVKLPQLNGLSVGTDVDFGPRGTFQVEDMHRVFCDHSEGELPMNAVLGRRSMSVDLATNDGRMATIEYANDEIRAFAGRYVDFDDFKFKNLREIDGW